MDGKTYARDLPAFEDHSEIRTAGRFSAVPAVAGIDQSLRLGDVLLIIRGDEKELFRGRIQRKESPKPLDLEITGIRELEITVDFGEPNDPTRDDVGDHLDLADARVIK
ncbi:MAG: NPCBM/NEW2 domain-containing protein [Planctomycetales bacterium]